MLWLFILVLIAGLSFVLFHKPPLNVTGAVRAARPLPASTPQTGEASEEAVTLRLSRDAGEDAVTASMARQAPQTPDTFDLNELFGAKKQQAAADRPEAS